MKLAMPIPAKAKAEIGFAAMTFRLAPSLWPEHPTLQKVLIVLSATFHSEDFLR